VAKTAIDAARFDAYWIEPERLKVIINKAHPLYDPRIELPVDEQLVVSMMTEGFTTVITVAKDGEDIVVIDGKRRYKAACEANVRLKKLGREQIKMACVNKRADENALFGVLVTANENRVNTSEVERAKLVQRLMGFGRTEEEAGATIGLDKTKTNRLLKLLACDKKVQNAVESGKLSPSAAAKLSVLPNEKQVEKLEEILAEGPTERSSRATVQKVAKAVKNAQGDFAAVPPTKKEVKDALKQAEGDTECSVEVQDVLRWVATGQLAEGWFKKWLKGE
jgi:ParB family chromosome partitioning protein